MTRLRIWYLAAFAVLCTEFVMPLFLTPGISWLVWWWHLGPPTDFLDWRLLALIASKAAAMGEVARQEGWTGEEVILVSYRNALFVLTWILVLWAFLAVLPWATKSYDLGFVVGILNLVSVLLLFFLFTTITTPVMNCYGYSQVGASVPSFGLGLAIIGSVMMIAELPVRKLSTHTPHRLSRLAERLMGTDS